MPQNSKNWWDEFLVILERSFKDSYRNPFYLRSRFFMVLLISLLTCSVYHDLGYSYTDAYSKAGFIFFSWSNFMTLNYFGTAVSIVREKQVLVKEYRNQTYGVVPYYFARMWIELPFTIFLGLMFWLINYFSVGLDEDFSKFSLFVLTLSLLILCSSALGVVVGTISNDEKVAIALGTLSNGALMIFSGYIINLDHVYVWIRWLQYLCPTRYAAEILLRNEFEDNPKYSFNPMNTYNLNFGTLNWLIMLTLITWGLRVISIIALKRSIK